MFYDTALSTVSFFLLCYSQIATCQLKKHLDITFDNDGMEFNKAGYLFQNG